MAAFSFWLHTLKRVLSLVFNPKSFVPCIEHRQSSREINESHSRTNSQNVIKWFIMSLWLNYNLRWLENILKESGFVEGSLSTSKCDKYRSFKTHFKTATQKTRQLSFDDLTQNLCNFQWTARVQKRYKSDQVQSAADFV